MVENAGCIVDAGMPNVFQLLMYGGRLCDVCIPIMCGSLAVAEFEVSAS